MVCIGNTVGVTSHCLVCCKPEPNDRTIIHITKRLDASYCLISIHRNVQIL